MERIRISVSAGISKDSKLRMQNELNQIARSLRINIGTGNNQGLGGLSRDLTALSTNINRITANLSQMDRGLRSTTGNINGLRNNIQNASQHTRSFAENVALTAKKFAMWVGMAQLVYQPFRMLKDGIATLKEIDKVLTEIAKVTNLTTKQMEQLAIKSASVGKEFGRTSQEFLTAYRDFARAGLGESSEELAKMSLLLQNVGDMDVTSANETLIATVEGMGLAYSDTINIIDKMDNVANRNAVSVQKLSDGIKNFGSTATIAGLNLDQTIALLGTGSATLQKSGSEIGNALKTMTMRITGVSDSVETFEEDISKAETSLRSVGIEVRDSTDSFRPVMDILDEVGSKFKTLSDVEKSAVTESLAGKQRANVLKSILMNYDMVQKQLNESQTAYGSAMKENAIYMESIEAKTKQLSATMTEFWQRSINSSLIKQVIDFASSLATLARQSGGLSTIIKTIAVAFASWKFLPIIQGIITTRLQLSGMAIELVNASRGQLTYSQALRQVRLEQQTTTVSTNGLKIAFASLSIVLTGITLLYGFLANKEAEAKFQREQHIQSIEEEKNSLKNSITEYENLKQQQLQGKDVRQQLEALQKSMLENYDLEANKLDLVSGKYKDQIDILNEYLSKKSEELLLVGKVDYEQAKKEMKSTSTTDIPFTILPGVDEKAISDLDKYSEKLDVIEKKTNVLGQTTFYLKGTLNEQKSALQEIITEYGKSSELTTSQTSLLKTLEKEFISIESKIEKNTTTINNYNKALSDTAFTDKFKNDISKAKDLFIELQSTQSEAAKTGLTESLQKLQDEMINTAEKGKDTENTINNIKSLFSLLTPEVEESSNALDENTTKLEDNTKAGKDEYSALEDLKNQMNFLSKAQKELTEDRKLSGDSMLEILKKYPELIQYIGNESAMLKAVKQAQLDKGKTAKDVMEAEMLNSNSYWQYLLKGNADLVNSLSDNYGIDLTNFNSVASAKLDADNKIRSAIGQGWASLYSNSGYTPRQQVGAAIGMLTSMSVGSAQEANARRQEIQKLQSIANNYDAVTQFATAIKATVETVNLKGASLVSASGSGSKKAEKTGSAPSATVSANEKLIERDRYYSLNQELTRYNQLIQKNQALQESAKDAEKVKLLEAEIKLSKEKQNILHKIANENRKEREEIVASLKKQGVKFTGTGDSIKATNAQAIIDKQIAETNKHRADKNKTVYNREKEELDKLQKQLNTFFKIQNEEIGDLQKDWINLTSSINELGTSIEELYTKQLTDSFDDFSNKTDIQNNTIGELEHQINMLGETQSEQITKMQLYKNQIDETTKLQNLYSNEIARLNVLVPRNASEQELLTQQLSELSLKSQEASKNIYDLNQNIKSTTESIIEQQKTEADKMISSYLKNLTKDIQEQVTTLESAKQKEIDKYTESITLIEKEIELLELKEDSLKEEESRQDKLLEIEKARKKLTDNKEKNIRVYKAGVGFVYESDVKQKVQDTDKLKELEIEYARWERDLSTKKQIEKKQAEIEAKRVEQETTTKHYEKEIEKLNTFISDQNKIFEEQDNYQIKNLENLYIYLSTLDSQSYITRLESLKTFVTDYNKELGELDLVDLAQQNTTIPIPTGTPIIPQVYTNTETQQTATTPKIDTPSVNTTQPKTSNTSEDMVWVNQGVEGKKVLESVSSVEARQKIRYDKAIQEGNIVKANTIKSETEAVTKRIAMFRNEGYTGTGFNEALIKVHPEEFILNKSTVSDMLTGNISSMIGKVPGLKINPNNNTTSTHSETFNVQNINVSTNDAYDFHKNLKQIIQKR